MSKLNEMLRIGIMQESGLNVRGLIPGTRVDWIGSERKGMDWKGMDWKEWIQKQ